jgi:hypothetical protein
VVSTRRANAGIVWVSTPGDYATLNSNHTPDGTQRKLEWLLTAQLVIVVSTLIPFAVLIAVGGRVGQPDLAFCHNIGRLVFDYDLLWQQCHADAVRVRIVNTMSYTLDPRLFA